jgi:hypothetical protein
MTTDQHAQILNKLAYLHGELCQANGIRTTNEHNYEMAVKMMNLELEVNGDEWLLSLIKENKDEDNTSI